MSSQFSLHSLTSICSISINSGTVLFRYLVKNKMVFFMKGIFAPVFTPVDSKGQLNLKVIPQYAKHLSGIDGVLVGGTSGEAMCLSVEERKKLLEAWIAEARPLGLKIVVQVGGAPMPDVIALAIHAEQTKADGIMTLPELYFKPRTPEKLVDYLEQVSGAAPSLPIIYYHFPAMTGVDMNMPELFKIATSRIPNFKGFKADLSVANQLDGSLAHDQRIFIANHMLAPSVMMGHDSSIATVTNLFPGLVRELVSSASGEGVSKELMDKQAYLNAAFAAVTQQGKWDFVPSMKLAMELMTGIPVGPPRRPLNPLNEHQRELMITSLDKLNNMFDL